MASSTRFHGPILGLLIALVALQVALVTVLGLGPKPPEIADSREDNLANTATRLKELESILAPPPVLPFSDDPDPRMLKIEEHTRPPDQPKSVPEIRIEPVYFETLVIHEELTPEERKKEFIATVLPLILRANQELSSRREQVLDAIEDGDLDALMQWAELYRNDPIPTETDAIGDELLLRVNTIPVSIALGQSAIESGWGTSRFAADGNALFGQWAWSEDAGLRPEEARYDNAVVRAFPDLFASVRAYMHNLNTHYGYEDFRRVRSTDDHTTNALIDTLTLYSEEREVYVEKVKDLIKANDFAFYDGAVLADQ